MVAAAPVAADRAHFEREFERWGAAPAAEPAAAPGGADEQDARRELDYERWDASGDALMRLARAKGQTLSSYTA